MPPFIISYAWFDGEITQGAGKELILKRYILFTFPEYLKKVVS